jgi:hypothetical protein
MDPDIEMDPLHPTQIFSGVVVLGWLVVTAATGEILALQWGSGFRMARGHCCYWRDTGAAGFCSSLVLTGPIQMNPLLIRTLIG